MRARRPSLSLPLTSMFAPLLLAAWLSCGGESDTTSSPSGGGTPTGTGGGGPDAGEDAPTSDSGDAAPDADPGPNELPCDVRAAIEAACRSCHSSPPTSEAPIALVSRYDFLQPSSVPGESLGERSLERMKNADAPMPPATEPPAADWHITAFEGWVAAGMPPGDCGAIPGKPAETTCQSGLFWGKGDMGDADMNPGLACRACHQMLAPEHAYFFSGTVFPDLHEQDLCTSPPPAGAHVEILDAQGNVTLTITPGAAGNFTSSAVVAGVPVPYRARLVANGLTRSMSSAQTSGDCNSCHTEQGKDGAPGRLVWPREHAPPP